MRSRVIILAMFSLSAAAGAFGICRAAGRITYATYFNGAEVHDEGHIVIECVGAITCIRTEDAEASLPQAPTETRTIDYAGRNVYQTAAFGDGSRCTVVTDFTSLPACDSTADRTTILGYECRRARAVVRSNQIDVWYTTRAGLQGSPSGQFVIPGAAILRIVRNGNYEILAKEIESTWTPPAGWRDEPRGDLVALPEYRWRTAEAFVTTIPVFDHEAIRFVPESCDTTSLAAPLDSTRVLRFASGTVIVRRVELPAVSDDYAVFAELTHRSRGDAYDRTGSVFVIPTDRARSFLDALRAGVQVLPATPGREGRVYQGIAATREYVPPIELMRFITPFGVGHYNREVTVRGLTWADSVLYKQDVTEILPVLRGRVWIGAFIGNYDAGGHEVSLRLRFYPGNRRPAAEAPRRRWTLPLFDTVNRMEMAGQEYGRIFEHDTLRVAFEIPDGLARCRLRYITTGHGGWENGDEFVPKVNRILVDGRLVGAVTPWRTDCATYRASNPASGNFWNGLSSSDFSRSGWCPGAAVSPDIVPLDDLAPGRHEIQVVIPAGAPEGGSFSAWNVSGMLLGEY